MGDHPGFLATIPCHTIYINMFSIVPLPTNKQKTNSE